MRFSINGSISKGDPFFFVDRKMNENYLSLKEKINSGYFIMLMGPRSCGKTTLVKEIIAEEKSLYDYY